MRLSGHKTTPPASGAANGHAAGTQTPGRAAAIGGGNEGTGASAHTSRAATGRTPGVVTSTRLNLSEITVDPALLALIPKRVADLYQLVPVSRTDQTLTVAMTNPNDLVALDELRQLTGLRVQPIHVTTEEFQRALVRFYAAQGVTERPVARPAAETDEEDVAAETTLVLGATGQAGESAPAIRLLNHMLEQAIQQRVSDVHIQPAERDTVVRFRIDGVMYNWSTLRPDQHPPLISRLKVVARMNIAERRLPLDGRFTTHLQGQRYDVRVSTIPGVHGEKAVLRLLPKGTKGLELEELGMDAENLALFGEMVQKPHGMILVTGPTGSGKTTTLYAALRRIDCVAMNAITVEDPVEYELSHVTQMQVHPKIGLTFAAGLRSILRQDPDIIMVGEIRDPETLEMAVQAALTGHLVFSTLHCNDAAGAAARCIDMGLEPFLLTSSVIAIVAQRLVRKICPRCRVQEIAPPELAARLEIAPGTALWRGEGCQACRNTGYQGRLAVFELLKMTEAIKQLIHRKEAASTIRRAAVEGGMVSLRADAIRKVLAGLTTPQEILRAVYLEEE
jgi:type II secretory ATPase GspE/PulE/Tfp pilus assembly ATPase PilB-like protein